MGRDWTPKELYEAEKVMNERGESFRSMKLIDTRTGEEVKLGYDNPKYPNLSFLYGQEFPDNERTEEAERALSDIIEAFDNGDFYVPKTEVETIMFRWYQGQLADGFYYNTENNEMLKTRIWGTEEDE